MSWPFSVRVMSQGRVEWILEGPDSGGLSAVFCFGGSIMSPHAFVPVRPGKVEIFLCEHGRLLQCGYRCLHPDVRDGRGVWKMAAQPGEALMDEAAIIAWVAGKLDRMRAGEDPIMWRWRARRMTTRNPRSHKPSTVPQ